MENMKEIKRLLDKNGVDNYIFITNNGVIVNTNPVDLRVLLTSTIRGLYRDEKLDKEDIELMIKMSMVEEGKENELYRDLLDDLLNDIKEKLDM